MLDKTIKIICDNIAETIVYYCNIHGNKAQKVMKIKFEIDLKKIGIAIGNWFVTLMYTIAILFATDICCSFLSQKIGWKEYPTFLIGSVLVISIILPPIFSDSKFYRSDEKN